MSYISFNQILYNYKFINININIFSLITERELKLNL